MLSVSHLRILFSNDLLGLLCDSGRTPGLSAVASWSALPIVVERRVVVESFSDGINHMRSLHFFSVRHENRDVIQTYQPDDHVASARLTD